jgi:hypothetical protein
VDENSAVNGNKYVDQILVVKDEDAEVIILSVGAEADITELESYEERQVFLEDMGLTEPGASVLIRAAYKLLKQTNVFYRRCKRGSCLDNRCWVNCPTSGRSDSYRLRKGFIRAEVIDEFRSVRFRSKM